MLAFDSRARDSNSDANSSGVIPRFFASALNRAESTESSVKSTSWAFSIGPYVRLPTPCVWSKMGGVEAIWSRQSMSNSALNVAIATPLRSARAWSALTCRSVKRTRKSQSRRSCIGFIFLISNVVRDKKTPARRPDKCLQGGVALLGRRRFRPEYVGAQIVSCHSTPAQILNSNNAPWRNTCLAPLVSRLRSNAELVSQAAQTTNRSGGNINRKEVFCAHGR